MSVLPLVHLEHVRQLFPVQCLPGIFPAHRELGRLAVARGGVKAEFPRRRHRLLVELGEMRREARGLRRLLADLTEVCKKEVGGRSGGPVLTPSVGFGAEGRGNGVDGLVGFELAFAHKLVAFSGCDPRMMLGRCDVGGGNLDGIL